MNDEGRYAPSAMDSDSKVRSSRRSLTRRQIVVSSLAGSIALAAKPALAQSCNSNVSLGCNALASLTTGTGNTAIGAETLTLNTSGNLNSALGLNALHSNTTGAVNTGVGDNALSGNSTGSFNTAVGSGSLGANTTGGENTAVGVEALAQCTTGSSNTAVGQAALRLATTTTNNTALGEQTLASTTTGSSNTAVGAAALVRNTVGAANVAAGYLAAENITSGSNNTALGYRALDVATTGNNNVAIGSNAGDSITTGSNVVCIGYNAQPSSAAASNEVVLGNSSTVMTRLRGQVVNSTLPSFLAQPTGLFGSVTGDGTTYTVLFGAEQFDRGGHFDALSTFTAPVSGIYRFSVSLEAELPNAAHDSTQVRLVTTSMTYDLAQIGGSKVKDGANVLTCGGTILVPMSQSDTAYVTFRVTGPSKTVSLYSGSFFCGELVA
jgi:hypothetical protein